jgi:hypothetical protein
MLGSLCSPCCSSCKPTSTPDSVEIDITSRISGMLYSWIKYRTGASTNGSGSLCEANHADSFLSYPINSGTYSLAKTYNGGAYANYSFSNLAFGMSASVSSSPTQVWGGNISGRVGNGVSLYVIPLRITTTRKVADLYSGISVDVATQSEMESESASITSVTSGTTDGVSWTKSIIGNVNGPDTMNIADQFMTACVGGPGATNLHPSIMNSTQPDGSMLPLTISAQWENQYTTMTDDAYLVNNFYPYSIHPCGQGYPLPLVLGVGGEYDTIYDAYNNPYYVNGSRYTARFLKYSWTSRRDFTIDAIRGVNSDGSTVVLL